MADFVILHPDTLDTFGDYWNYKAYIRYLCCVELFYKMESKRDFLKIMYGDRWYPNKLFVSNNETTNSPIYEIKVLH